MKRSSSLRECKHGCAQAETHLGGRRFQTVSDFEEITRTTPEKSLTEGLTKKAGRNNHGRVTSRRRGGGVKRLYRIIDFKRNKLDIPATVAHIEYDPNRTARIALLHYADGEKRYILAPLGVKQGDVIVSGEKADIKPRQRASHGPHSCGYGAAQYRTEPRSRRSVLPRRWHLCPARGQGRQVRPVAYALR